MLPMSPTMPHFFETLRFARRCATVAWSILTCILDPTLSQKCSKMVIFTYLVQKPRISLKAQSGQASWTRPSRAGPVGSRWVKNRSQTEKIWKFYLTPYCKNTTMLVSGRRLSALKGRFSARFTRRCSRLSQGRRTFHCL